MVTTHGMRVEINWHKLPVGGSVFVPGADTRKLKRELRSEANLTEYNIRIEEVVELGITGVRVWRMA